MKDYLMTINDNEKSYSVFSMGYKIELETVDGMSWAHKLCYKNLQVDLAAFRICHSKSCFITE
jgi:hypothetical protein